MISRSSVLYCVTLALTLASCQNSPVLDNFQFPQTQQFLSPKSLLTSYKKPGPKLQHFSPLMAKSWFQQSQDPISFPELPGFSSLSRMPSMDPLSGNIQEIKPTVTELHQNSPPHFPNPFPQNPQSQPSLQPAFPPGFFNFPPGLPPGFNPNMAQVASSSPFMVPNNNGDLPPVARKIFPLSQFFESSSSLVPPVNHQSRQNSALVEYAAKDLASHIPAAAAFAMNSETLKLPGGKYNQKPKEAEAKNSDAEQNGLEANTLDIGNSPKNSIDSFSLGNFYSRKSLMDALQAKINSEQQQTFAQKGNNNNNSDLQQQLQGMTFN